MPTIDPAVIQQLMAQQLPSAMPQALLDPVTQNVVPRTRITPDQQRMMDIVAAGGTSRDNPMTNEQLQQIRVPPSQPSFARPNPMVPQQMTPSAADLNNPGFVQAMNEIGDYARKRR